LGVLQAKPYARGAIQFDPEPRRIFTAARSLRFGYAYRVTFRFPYAFSEDEEKLQRAGFLVSREKQFFTWWTMHLVLLPLLTAWTAGSAAEGLKVQDPAKIAALALVSLRRILKRTIPVPDAFYFHNWREDPFSRGAYSYAPVGAVPARKALATPEADTLFFAGEACDFDGHDGTVQGAIASGQRAATLIQRAAGE
jgi:monoamine oxidase